LLLVVQAGSALAPFLGMREGGEQHGSQDGDDGNDHQQLNQGKRAETTWKP